MTTRLLHEIGAALYGPRWQTDLSRDLSVSDRTMRRWAAGADEPRQGVFLDLHRILLERAMTLDALAERTMWAASHAEQ